MEHRDLAARRDPLQRRDRLCADQLDLVAEQQEAGLRVARQLEVMEREPPSDRRVEVADERLSAEPAARLDEAVGRKAGDSLGQIEQVGELRDARDLEQRVRSGSRGQRKPEVAVGGEDLGAEDLRSGTDPQAALDVDRVDPDAGRDSLQEDALTEVDLEAVDLAVDRVELAVLDADRNLQAEVRLLLDSQGSRARRTPTRAEWDGRTRGSGQTA